MLGGRGKGQDGGEMQPPTRSDVAQRGASVGIKAAGEQCLLITRP